MKISEVLEVKRAIELCPPLGGKMAYALAKNLRVMRGVEQDINAALKAIQAAQGGVAGEDGSVKYPTSEARQAAQAEWEAALGAECEESLHLVQESDLLAEVEKREIAPAVLAGLMALTMPQA